MAVYTQQDINKMIHDWEANRGDISEGKRMYFNSLLGTVNPDAPAAPLAPWQQPVVSSGDEVALPQAEMDRLKQESLATQVLAAQNPTAHGWIAPNHAVPTLEQYLATNPTIVGDNSKEYQYLVDNGFIGTNKSDIWETVLPMAGMAAMGAAAGGLFGNLGTGEFAGMGTFGAPAASAPAAAPASSAVSATPASVGSSAAPAAGAPSLAEMQALQNSLFPATTSALPAVNTAAPAFGSTLGSVGGAAGGFSIPGMVTNLANSAELIPGVGYTPGILEQITSAVGNAASSAGSALTQPTSGSTLGIPNNVLGGILQGGLGYLGADKQAEAFQNVYNQQSAIGAPYRDRLNASYAPNFDLMSQPGYGDAFNRMAEISTNSWSPKGNPANNPGIQAGVLNDVWSQNYLPALSNYRGQLGQFGGLGLNTAGQASLMGAQTADNGIAALAGGVGRIFGEATQPSFDDILKKLGGNLSLNVGGTRY
jgi:hypothetical protein